MATKKVNPKQVARVAAKKALANGASPAKAVAVGAGVAARALQTPFYTPMFFKSRRTRMQSVSSDPTVTYLPEARALNQRDPTVVGVQQGTQEVFPVGGGPGVEGFFDTLPSWVTPVAIGAAVLVALLVFMKAARR